MCAAWEKAFSKVFFVLACAVYLISFGLPVIDNTQNPPNHMSIAPRGEVLGFEAFVRGPFAFLALCPAWLANPAFWFGLWDFCKHRYRRSLIDSLIGLSFGLSAFVLLSDRSLVDQQEYLVGYYAWLASFVCLAVACLPSWRRSSKIESVGGQSTLVSADNQGAG